MDLTSTKRVVDQIDTARDFAFIAPELRNEGKLASLQENIFAMQVDDDSTSELGSEADSIRRLAPHLSVDPNVLRMMVDGGRFSGTALGSGNVGVRSQRPSS